MTFIKCRRRNLLQIRGKRVVVIVLSGDERLNFVRRNIAAGHDADFIYSPAPNSRNSAEVI